MSKSTEITSPSVSASTLSSIVLNAKNGILPESINDWMRLHSLDSSKTNLSYSERVRNTNKSSLINVVNQILQPKVFYPDLGTNYSEKLTRKIYQKFKKNKDTRNMFFYYDYATDAPFYLFVLINKILKDENGQFVGGREYQGNNPKRLSNYAGIISAYEQFSDNEEWLWNTYPNNKGRDKRLQRFCSVSALNYDEHIRRHESSIRNMKAIEFPILKIKLSEKAKNFLMAESKADQNEYSPSVEYNEEILIKQSWIEFNVKFRRLSLRMVSQVELFNCLNDYLDEVFNQHIWDVFELSSYFLSLTKEDILLIENGLNQAIQEIINIDNSGEAFYMGIFDIKSIFNILINLREDIAYQKTKFNPYCAYEVLLLRRLITKEQASKFIDEDKDYNRRLNQIGSANKSEKREIKPESSFILQCKTDAKRFLKILKEKDSSVKLSKTQDMIARIKGKSNWKELIKV